jgi:acetylglutamate kinase
MGFSGADGNLIQSKKPSDNRLQFVGDVKSVNARCYKLCFLTELLLFFCAITHDKNHVEHQCGHHCHELAIALSAVF